MKKGGRSQKAPAHFEPSQAVKMPTNMYTRKMLRQKRREENVRESLIKGSQLVVHQQRVELGELLLIKLKGQRFDGRNINAQALAEGSSLFRQLEITFSFQHLVL